MTEPQKELPATGEQSLRVILARELALNIRPLEAILESLGVSDTKFEQLKNDASFTRLLAQQMAEWESATNTQERVKLKASAMIEDWLPEAYARLHDRTENLPGKTELAKLITRIAGMGVDKVNQGASAEKVTVTINIGGQNQLTLQHAIPGKVIEAEAS